MWTDGAPFPYQCCRHSSGCWERSPPHAGYTAQLVLLWKHWPAFHRWSYSKGQTLTLQCVSLVRCYPKGTVCVCALEDAISSAALPSWARLTKQLTELLHITEVIQHFLLNKAGEVRDSLAFVESLHCCLPLLVLEAKHPGEISHVSLQRERGQGHLPTTNSLSSATFSTEPALTPALSD